MAIAPAKVMVPIGRFSQLTRLSIKALRHYDELGLLEPAHVDPVSGYRYYRVEQSQHAERIRVLRSLDMPLEEIRALLREQDPEKLRAKLLDHRGRLSDRIADLEAAARALDRLILGVELDGQYVAMIRELPPQLVACIAEEVSPATEAKWVGRAFRELYGHLLDHESFPIGPGLRIHHAEDVVEGSMRLEVCVPIAAPVVASGRIVSREIPAARVAGVVHRGAYEGLDAARRALMAWIEGQVLEIVGPLREVYTTSPAQTFDLSKLETEVLWPVR